MTRSPGAEHRADGAKVPLSDLTPDEIADATGLKPFQGAQIFRWLHHKGVFDFSAMTDLSKKVRQQLESACVARQVTVADSAVAARLGTRKILCELRDGRTVESVLLRDRGRLTVCVSSQAGCALGCPFCATGLGGFERNLRPGEIVEQALHLLTAEPRTGRAPNIVYMGMGEPFLNYDAVVKSIRLLMHPEGLGVGARKITVSTAGDVPGIRRFAQEGWQVRLAVSLHAANDRLRSRLVPLNRKYPLRSLMKALRFYTARSGRRFSIEWVLLEDVNDSRPHARELADLLGDLKAEVNLIPYNGVGAAQYAAPTRGACHAFQGALLEFGVKATLRRERGADIDAGCGQLRARARKVGG